MVSHGMTKTGAHLRADTEPRNICKARDKYRVNRTDRENIVDPVTAAMGQHIDHLDRNIDFLRQCEGDEVETLEALESTRKELESDLRNKAIALEIDLRCANISFPASPSHGAIKIQSCPFFICQLRFHYGRCHINFSAKL